MYVKESIGKGVSSDKNGYYSLKLPEGNYTLVIEYMGYETLTAPISLTRNMEINFKLEQASIVLDGAVVTAKRPDENVSGAQTGVQQMQVQQLNKLPVLFGEKDIIKSLELMPGVKTAGEGSTGFFVRGGSADQNLIIIFPKIRTGS